jgi:hypothetical protein
MAPKFTVSNTLQADFFLQSDALPNSVVFDCLQLVILMGPQVAVARMSA